MRHLTTFKETRHAALFTDYLVAEGVAAVAEEENGEWAVWVREENQIESAKEKLEKFLVDPENSRYRTAQTEAVKIRKQEAQKQEQAKKNLVDIRRQWRAGQGGRPIQLTMFTMIICGVIFVMTGFGDSRVAMFGKVGRSIGIRDQLRFRVQGGSEFAELRAGQVWRVWTCQLMHGDILHILMNMLLLWVLGGQLEARKGPLFLAIFMLVSGAVAIGVQMGADPMSFPIGMSGIGYGTFGYIWIKSRLDPRSGLMMSDQMVLMLLAWFVLCFAGVFGSIANWAHAGGLACGTLWAYLSSLQRK